MSDVESYIVFVKPILWDEDLESFHIIAVDKHVRCNRTKLMYITVWDEIC